MIDTSEDLLKCCRCYIITVLIYQRGTIQRHNTLFAEFVTNGIVKTKKKLDSFNLKLKKGRIF